MQRQVRAKACLPVLVTTALAIAFSSQPPGIKFSEVGRAAGIHGVTICGGSEKKFLVESNGSGLCWLDYNNDGWMDLYIVNGSRLEYMRMPPPQEERPRNYLYRNNAGTTFTEVAVEAGVAGYGWGTGCAAADYDNDGWTDLMVANFGPNLLFRNNGNRTFTDVAAPAGVQGGWEWHTGVAFADYDRDGHLDLYVAAYGDPSQMMGEPKECEFRGAKVFCGPKGLRGGYDTLYRNNRDGTFSDVTRSAGVAEEKPLHGFAVVFEDFSGDGWPDIFVSNDMERNYLYINKFDGTFEEQGVLAGLAYPDEGRAQANMGVAVGDYDRNGTMDLFVTTFSDDHYTLFRNEGEGLFIDLTSPAGLGSPTYSYLGWGTFFADFDNDGLLELLATNGHVYPQVDQIPEYSSRYRQRLLIFRQSSLGRFREIGEEAGLNNLPLFSSRAAARADYDNDGALDVVYSNLDAPPTLLRNSTRPLGRWITVRTLGTRSNRGGVGARVKVVAGSLTQYDSVRAGGSYLSSDDPRLHFGLGAAEKVDLMEIRWPSGTVDKLENLTPNQFLVIQEGKGIVPQEGKKAGSSVSLGF